MNANVIIHINIFKFKSLLHNNNIGSGLISFVASYVIIYTYIDIKIKMGDISEKYLSNSIKVAKS